MQDPEDLIKVKFKFQGREVIIEDKGKPVDVGSMVIQPAEWKQWIQGRQVTQHAEADCRARNIRAFTWGYEYECDMKLTNDVMPNTFTVTYVNQNFESATKRINAWCEKAAANEGRIAVNTEGDGEDTDGCDVFQIASERCRGVLVIHTRWFRRYGESNINADVLTSVQDLLKQTPSHRSFIDHRGLDDSKIWRLFDDLDILKYRPMKIGDKMDMIKMAKALGFGFELKRDNTVLKARGQRQGKASARVASELFHNLWLSRGECSVDISEVMPGDLCVTLSRWSLDRCRILTLEQSAYAALDAWITLAYGIVNPVMAN
jgi:hypothetical protein